MTPETQPRIEPGDRVRVKGTQCCGTVTSVPNPPDIGAQVWIRADNGNVMGFWRKSLELIEL